jgi:hypothetical protein
VDNGRYGLVACAVVGYRCTQISDFFDRNKDSECFIKNGWNKLETFLEHLIGTAPPERKEVYLSRAVLGVLMYAEFFRLFVKCPNIVLVSNVGCAGIMHHRQELEQKITTHIEEMECWHLGDYGMLFSWIKHETVPYDKHGLMSTLSRDLITQGALQEVVDFYKELHVRVQQLKKQRMVSN